MIGTILSAIAIAGLLACIGIGIINAIESIKDKFLDITAFTIIAFIGAIIVATAYIYWMVNPHPTHEIEATSAQIDTIVTQCGEKQDTTYVIRYIK